MWTRKNQLEAYQFLRRRLVSALVFRAANHPESPSRRLILASVTGIAISAIVLLGFGAYGLLKPGSASAWTAGGTVILEKETGALFVLDSEGTLRPVVNYASAALFLGSGRPEVTNVAQKSLRIRPRGPAIGIPQAPASVPAPDALVPGPWIACSQAPLGQGGTPRPVVSLLVGDDASVDTMAADAGLLVSEVVSGDVHLLQDGIDHRIGSEDVASALGLAGSVPVPVGAGWLNTVPKGADIDFLSIPDAGSAGPDLADRATTIGEVFVVERAGDEGGEGAYFVSLSDGLAPVNATQAELIIDNLDNPARPADGSAISLPAGVAAVASPSTITIGVGIPDELPVPLDIEGDTVAVCATAEPSGDDDDAVVIGLADVAPMGEFESAIPVGGQGPSGPLADIVSVASGRGCLAQEVVAGGAGLGTHYLVTDEGRRFPLEMEATESFDYSADAVSSVPKAFLALLPLGPQLSQAAASLTVLPGAGVPAEPATPSTESIVQSAGQVSSGHFSPAASWQ